jgi:hypothetical protein
VASLSEKSSGLWSKKYGITNGHSVKKHLDTRFIHALHNQFENHKSKRKQNLLFLLRIFHWNWDSTYCYRWTDTKWRAYACCSGSWNRKVSYRATPALTCGLGFCDLIWRTTPLYKSPLMTSNGYLRPIIECICRWAIWPSALSFHQHILLFDKKYQMKWNSVLFSCLALNSIIVCLGWSLKFRYSIFMGLRFNFSFRYWVPF